MKQRTKEILELLKEEYPDAKCELNYKTPFQLLVATILSAQTTDKKVNEVTKTLFNDYPDVESFSKITQEELENRIRVIGLYRNKTKNLLMMCKQLKENFNGEVPKTIEEISSLAGAGRKTANVVISNAFNIPAIAVDTHVFRVAHRFGITNSKDDVLSTEKKLKKYFKESEYNRVNSQMVLFGRYICTSKKPKCELCNLKNICKEKNIQ